MPWKACFFAFPYLNEINLFQKIKNNLSGHWRQTVCWIWICIIPSKIQDKLCNSKSLKIEGLAECGIWSVTALSSHTSWHTPSHRLYEQPFVWNKSVWLLLQHNLLFITSENVVSSASNTKKFRSRIFHCDFKLFYFHYKTEVLDWVFFFKKVLHENLNFWRCQNHYFVLPHNTKKIYFLQK